MEQPEVVVDGFVHGKLQIGAGGILLWSVAEQLDDGLIIVQQVINVNHTANAQTMLQSGKDVEQIVLSKALKLLCEDRIFLAGNRTVIFD